MLQLAPEDVVGIVAILNTYADQSLDLADAALMYLADREDVHTVFTVDQRHFSVFRNNKGQPLQIT